MEENQEEAVSQLKAPENKAITAVPQSAFFKFFITRSDICNTRNTRDVNVECLLDVLKANKSLWSSTVRSNTEKSKLFRDMLMNRYRTNSTCNKSFLCNKEDQDFSIEKYFVDVRLINYDDFEQGKEKFIEIKDIFGKKRWKHRTILITGDPGYGKTTICTKIGYDWAMHERSDFNVVVIIELRNLGNRDLIQVVHEYIFTRGHSSIEIGNALIIFDGLDEIRDKERVKQFIINDSFKISEEMTIIFTSRPPVTHTIRMYFDDHYCIAGFSPEQKVNFIDFMIKEDKDERDYLINLTEYDASELAKCPLLLHMLCCLPKSSVDREIKTKTDLFISIFHYIIQRYKIENGDTLKLKKGKFFDGEDLIIKLGSLCYSKEFQQHNQASILETQRISEEDLKNTFNDEEEYEFILYLNVFVKYSDQYFEFIDRMFLEFVLAFYVFHSLDDVAIPELDDILVFIFGLFQDNRFPENFINFLRRNLFHPVTWWNFYSEIIHEENKQIFREETRIVFYYDSSYDMLKLHEVCRFDPIYICIPSLSDFDKLSEDSPVQSRFFEEYDTPGYIYYNVKKELIKLFKSLRLMYYPKLRLHVLIEKMFCHYSFRFSHRFRNLNESVEALRHLFQFVKRKKFRVNLYGIIHRINSQFSILCEENIKTFSKVEEYVHAPEKNKVFYPKIRPCKASRQMLEMQIAVDNKELTPESFEDEVEKNEDFSLQIFRLGRQMLQMEFAFDNEMEFSTPESSFVCSKLCAAIDLSSVMDRIELGEMYKYRESLIAKGKLRFVLF
ncbi:uncharacterized protein [Centruroides vittatus]|uniref:uncharacterized protein n=1 Tax=Centruroides vittatus TaxID=120091 RepID=UPI00350F8936